jgi:putative alpha-1,2-mannosidase
VFNYAGQPWLTQYWVREVNEKAYGDITPDAGYGGHDEDQGQMGGVSALMSLGLFSLQGTCSQQPVYELTSPVFDEITIKLHPQYYKGTQFTIKSYNNAKENRYIQRAALNGQPFYDFRLPHSKFAEGGALELWLDVKPNKQWGIEK